MYNNNKFTLKDLVHKYVQYISKNKRLIMSRESIDRRHSLQVTLQERFCNGLGSL